MTGQVSGRSTEEDASTEHSLYLDTQSRHQASATGPGYHQHSALGSGIQAGGNNGHNFIGTYFDFLHFLKIYKLLFYS